MNRGDGWLATQSVLIATCSTLTADLNPTGRMSTQHAPEEQPTEEATRTPERIISQRLPGTNGELRTRARFLRGDCLGRGSFARAYQLTELQTSGSSSPIATKVLLKREVDVAKVAAEVALHRRLSHPHIVTCFDTFEDTAYLYLLLELCDLTAMHLLKQHGPLAVPCAARLVSQAACGLHHLHAEHLVIHRDVKPQNLLLKRVARGARYAAGDTQRDGGGGGGVGGGGGGGAGGDGAECAWEWEVKIADFGLSARLASREERRHTLCGTVNYLAPDITSNLNPQP